MKARGRSEPAGILVYKTAPGPTSQGKRSSSPSGVVRRSWLPRTLEFCRSREAVGRKRIDQDAASPEEKWSPSAAVYSEHQEGIRELNQVGINVFSAHDHPQLFVFAWPKDF